MRGRVAPSMRGAVVTRVTGPHTVIAHVHGLYAFAYRREGVDEALCDGAHPRHELRLSLARKD